MFKFVVICATLAVVSAAPGYLHGGISHPVATSYSSRVDVHSHAVPVVTKTIVSTPVEYHHAPVISSIDHGYALEYDGIHGLGYSGLGYGGLSHGYTSGISHGHY